MSKIKKTLVNYPEGQEGIKELEQIFSILAETGFDSKFFRYDPSIVRGLAYYTGPVWEIEIVEGDIGSVAGCGRYDTLTKMISGIDIPASGGSFGVERICQVLKERKMAAIPSSIIKVLVTIFSPKLAPESRSLARKIRQSGFNVEVYIEPQDKLEKQLKYADKKKIPFVVILGPDEVKTEKATLKNLKTGDQKTLTPEKLLVELNKK